MAIIELIKMEDESRRKYFFWGNFWVSYKAVYVFNDLLKCETFLDTHRKVIKGVVDRKVCGYVVGG